jgi:hypothetical protein
MVPVYLLPINPAVQTPGLLPLPRRVGMLHVRSEHGVHAALIAGSRLAEPFEHVTVDPKGDGHLGCGRDDVGVRPEVRRQFRELRWSRAVKLRFAEPSQTTQLRLPAAGLTALRALRGSLGGTLVAHVDCSLELR